MAISGPRLLAITLTAALLVAGVFAFWLHAQLVVAVLGAAAFGAVFMLVAASLGDDPAEADAAWRAAAIDLVGRVPAADADRPTSQEPPRDLRREEP
jgi:hypothetical protein